MKFRPFVLALVCLLLAGTSDDKEPRPGPEATIDDMAWLAGHWLGEGLGGISEELWSPPRAGTMMGVYRLLKDGEVSFYEMLLIVEDGNSLAMQLKHFTPDFKGWEEKDEFLHWPLKEISEGQAHFGSLKIKREDDELFMWLKMRQKDGTVKEVPFQFKKVKD